jgi:competence protein ComEC
MLFFAVRFLLSLIPHFAEARPIKKYAAIIAIIANFGYLLISGSTVSAQRAFVMVSLIMLGVVMDRAVTPMRSVAFAAFVILLVEPESLFSAGFQMSFAAVIALISVYELAMKKLFAHQEDDCREGQRWYAKLHNKIWLYPVSIMFTSLIAGLATAPFAAYHFNQVSNYHGVLANLLAVPIVSFWVTPFSIIAMLLMPFGLHWVGLVPMSYGVEVIIWISAQVSAIQSSSKMVPQMPNWGLICIIMGALWFLLWSRNWRYLGLAGIVAGVLSFQFVKLPDIIINENGKLYAVNYDGKLYLPYFRKSFASKSWLEEFGQKEMLRLPKQENYEVKGFVFGFNCDSSSRASAGGVAIQSFWIASSQAPRNDECITLDQLKEKGTHNIYLNNGEIVVKTVEENKLPRIWTKKYVRNSWNHQ